MAINYNTPTTRQDRCWICRVDLGPGDFYDECFECGVGHDDEVHDDADEYERSR